MHTEASSRAFSFSVVQAGNLLTLSYVSRSFSRSDKGETHVVHQWKPTFFLEIFSSSPLSVSRVGCTNYLDKVERLSTTRRERDKQLFLNDKLCFQLTRHTPRLLKLQP
jgi:hypothetical protein